jgi:hypothetical protein
MIKRLMFVAVLSLIVGGVVNAQTIYTQTAPVLCEPGTVHCNVEVQLDGEDHTYLINCGQNAISKGCEGFDFDGVSGKITDIVTYFPGLGKSGAFSFKFELSDGRSGSVSGQAHWTKLKAGYQAEIDSSTVTVN